MSSAPVSDQRRRERLIDARVVERRVPTIGDLARRRLMMRVIKWLLPAAALALLATIALWPQFEVVNRQEQAAIGEFRAQKIDGASVRDARYRGVDERGRPYTVTADTATQMGPDRVDLSQPKGDVTTGSGGWLLVRARQGVFAQVQHQLDLSNHVMLYRDDGTTLRTPSATIDFKAGAAAGSDAVHAEGPFGTLDSPEGFALVDHGAVVQFPGPGTLVMNAAGGQGK